MFEQPESPAEGAPPEPPLTPEGGLDSPPPREHYNPDGMTLLGDLIQHPTRAFRYLAAPRAQRVGLAVVVYTASQMAPNWFRDPFGIPVAGQGARLVGNAAAALLSLVVGVGIWHLCARLLGGRNAYAKLFQAVGLAALPGLLATPFYVVGVATGNNGLWGFAGFVAGLWAFVLHVLAVREVYGFSTRRAVAVVVLPAAGAVAFILLLAVVAGLLGVSLLPFFSAITG